jgi:hypothetical protein
MAWSDPGDFTSGQILTAAQMDSIREAMFFGQGTFTNEAARDLAYAPAGAMSPITLQEGMRAYLTAPTVPAAAGTVTFLPSGITTVYNGSVWVTTTPLSAQANANGTTTSTSFTATLSGSPGTNPSVTLATGTTALVTVKAALANDTTGAGVYMGVAVSGASTVAATTTECVYNGGTASQFIIASASFVVSMSNAGTHTFTAQYRVGSTGTGTFGSRQIIVQGIA